MKRTGNGFSMVGVLVTIVVVGLAVSILLPTLRSGRRPNYPAVCRSNLSGIGKAIATYQTTYSSYPFIRNTQGMDPTAAPKKAMSKAEFEQLIDKKNTDTNIHIIDNLLLLKYTSCLDSYKIFRCPKNPNQHKLMDRDESNEYGFSDGKEFYFDYAYHAGYRYQGEKYNRAAFRESMASMPILADAPGKSLQEFQDRLEDEDDSDNDGAGYNHGQDVINCLYPDASVMGHQKVYTDTPGEQGGPPVNNIYTVDLRSDGTSNGNTVRPTGKEEIMNKRDSVLIPANIRQR